MSLSKQDRALLDACGRYGSKGDLEAARRALQNGAYIQAKNQFGETALHNSLYYKHVDIAFFLIENNADVNAKDKDGDTPLHRAARSGLDSAVSLLLEKGADPSITNNGGNTPLQWASHQKCIDILKLVAGKSQQERKRLMKEWREKERQMQEKYKQERLLQEQQKKLEKFKKECLGKFATRTALDQELERLETLIEEAQLSLDPNVNAAAAKTQEEYDGYLPCRELPEYAEVPLLEAMLKEKKQAARAMKFGPERTKAVQEIDELEKRLQREYNDGAESGAISRVKKNFYDHFEEIQTFVKDAKENEFISLVPIFKQACQDMTDFLQLKYFFTAVNAQHSLGTITSNDRKDLIVASLKKAGGSDMCTSPFHVAMYRVALRYAKDQGIITQFKYDELDVKALESDISNTNFIQDMQAVIRENTARLDRLENALASFQKAVVESYQDLQRNMVALNNNVNSLRDDVRQIHANTQALARSLNKFQANMAFKLRVEAGCSLVSSILNAISMGAAGSALQGALGFTLAHIADFGDMVHLREIMTTLAVPTELLGTVGEISIHDMLEQGLALVENQGENALEDAVQGKNAVVLISASAAVFSTTVELDAMTEPTVDESVKTEPATSPDVNAKKAEAVSPDEREAVSNMEGEDQTNKDEEVQPPIAVAVSTSASKELEKKLAKLKKKRGRRISDAKVAKDLGQDEEAAEIFKEIKELSVQIEDLHGELDELDFSD